MKAKKAWARRIILAVCFVFIVWTLNEWYHSKTIGGSYKPAERFNGKNYPLFLHPHYDDNQPDVETLTFKKGFLLKFRNMGKIVFHVNKFREQEGSADGVTLEVYADNVLIASKLENPYTVQNDLYADDNKYRSIAFDFPIPADTRELKIRVNGNEKPEWDHVFLEQVIATKSNIFEKCILLLVGTAFMLLFFEGIWENNKIIIKIFLEKIKIILADKIIKPVLEINYKQFIIPVLGMFGLYVLGITSIIRANFYYSDDLGRTIYGYRGWNNFSRYISDFLSIFIHSDVQINDISPLPQLIAAFIIAIASVLLVFIICDKKISKRTLFASLPVGLSPYFLECFSYKFDSPYMALSILASVIPFLFMENYLVFSIFSIISLLIMCMTYQVSSGIYVMIVVLLCFQNWNLRRKTNKEIIGFAGFSAILYCGAMVIFRLLFMKAVNDYVSTSMYPVSRLFSGVINNFTRYIKLINSDFGNIWKILIALLVIGFIIKTFVTAKNNKIFAIFSSFAVIALLYLISYGVYLTMENPLYLPRALYGFGIFTALLGIYIADSRKKLFSLPAIALSWCFFVFSFSYGNALADQKRYNDFRTEILLHDLSVLFPSAKGVSIRLQKSEGHVPSIKNIASKNSVINRLVPINLAEDWIWSNIYLTSYYNFKITQDNSIKDENLSVIYDSYYHTIKSDGNRVLVILK